MNKPVIKLMCGLPRSGKSTITANYMKNGYIKICADQLRLIMTGKTFHPEGEGIMWAVHDIMMRALMEQGVNIVVDECNITKRTRKRFLQMAMQYGYDIDLIYVATSYETCKIRAIEQNNLELADVIDSMASSWETPSADEGFNRFIKINEGGTVREGINHKI